MKRSMLVPPAPAARLWRLLLAGALLACAGAAIAGVVGATYVKTIGQSWPVLPLMSGGGRLAVDESGSVYAGVPGMGSVLQKITPDGRVIWRFDDAHQAYTGLVVDDRYVYGCGLGYYGWGHLVRVKRDSGLVAPGWVFTWKTPDEVVRGVRGFKNPGALLVDTTFLYVLDLGSGELRRLHKETGEEKPFPVPVKIADANDLAFSRTGSMLALTKTTVVEVDRLTGKILKPALVANLRGAVALAVNRQTGALYIGEGGTPDMPVNIVRVFSASGTDTGMTIGPGGEWQGTWRPGAFGFSTGAADIALDPRGGLWTNVYAHRMPNLAVLTHVTAAGKADRVLLGMSGNGLAVDDNLNLYLGGNCSITFDGDLRWTSGLVQSGKPGQFPSTLTTWSMTPIFATADRAVFTITSPAVLFSLHPFTGVSLKQELKLPADILGMSCPIGASIYIAGARGEGIFRTTRDLTAPEPFFTAVPEAMKKLPITGFSVSDDLATVFLSAGHGDAAVIAAFERGGKKLWEVKGGAIQGRYRNALLVYRYPNPGMTLLDADDGSFMGIIGAKARSGRAPIVYPKGVAIGRKDGIDYLFILVNYGVQVYRLGAGQ